MAMGFLRVLETLHHLRRENLSERVPANMIPDAIRRQDSTYAFDTVATVATEYERGLFAGCQTLVIID